MDSEVKFAICNPSIPPSIFKIEYALLFSLWVKSTDFHHCLSNMQRCYLVRLSVWVYCKILCCRQIITKEIVVSRFDFAS